jgi:hypothetical protein
MSFLQETKNDNRGIRYIFIIYIDGSILNNLNNS